MRMHACMYVILWQCMIIGDQELSTSYDQAVNAYDSETEWQLCLMA